MLIERWKIVLLFSVSYIIQIIVNYVVKCFLFDLYLNPAILLLQTIVAFQNVTKFKFIICERVGINKLCNIFIIDYRDQMNLATSFLDASAIYGNTDQQVENLRTYDAGLVNVTACSACRSNALYSAVLKEHNRVAVNLAELNKHWNDEVLFYESRRIVIAELQHITYNEYLPIVIGEVSFYYWDIVN